MTRRFIRPPSDRQRRRRPAVGWLLGMLLTGPALAYDMDQHLWAHRLLILAAPTAGDPIVQAQLEEVKTRRDAILDRDLRVFELYRDGALRDGEALSSEDLTALRRHFALDDDARVLILVGLDGGEKRRAPLDTPLSQLFLQIDAMPMRRADIRAKEAAGVPVTEP